ncbi:MAG: ATP-dependent DNA helicase DinG [Gammaproteobacteria bacterium]|nr:ATP-dependent DNA helicase DinG [Gammaproteobacteria bacterium]
MLTEALKTEIRASFEAAKSQLLGYSNRSSQNRMMAEIAKTLTGEYSNSNPILCVEAPTGTGKTMAYLIATLPIAKANDKKLVIASANVALQEQLLNKDIIEAQKYSTVSFDYALAKGRSRYVCVRNLINLTEDSGNTQSLFEDSLLWDAPPSKSQIDQLGEMTKNYTSNRWNGEVDDLETPPEFSLWQKAACNRFTCTAKNCDFYNDCAFFKARKKVAQADVIIANHDLILADIFNGNSILPDVEDCIFVFDEAHHFAPKALSHFSQSASLDFIKTSIRQAQSAMDQICKITHQDEVESRIKEVDNSLAELDALMTDLDYSDDIHLFKMTGIDSTITNSAEKLAASFRVIYTDFSEKKDDWQTFCKSNQQDQATADNVNNIIGQNEQNLFSIVSLLSAFTQNTNPDKPPPSHWIEKSIMANKKTNYHLNSAKIDVSNHLNSLIWSKAAGVVLTSATLTALGSFDRLNQQLGLKAKDNQYLRLSSPFDHQSVDFIVAKMKSNPTQAFEHTQELAKELKKRIDQKVATLVIFASNKQMQMVADLVEQSLDCSLLIQGEYSKKRILEKHIELRSKGKGSVIFGLDSFAEGVDLKGDNLNHVMIAKLRFSVPTSPIEKTTQSYLESQGRNPFMEIALPDASLRLIQACGRLIRTETDTGTITIFDNRLTTKFYGKQLLNSLPGYNVVIE